MTHIMHIVWTFSHSLRQSWDAGRFNFLRQCVSAWWTLATRNGIASSAPSMSTNAYPLEYVKNMCQYHPISGCLSRCQKYIIDYKLWWHIIAQLPMEVMLFSSQSSRKLSRQLWPLYASLLTGTHLLFAQSFLMERWQPGRSHSSWQSWRNALHFSTLSNGSVYWFYCVLQSTLIFPDWKSNVHSSNLCLFLLIEACS